MSQHVGEFFKNLGKDKIITGEDVRKCFEELTAKRRRLDPSSFSPDIDRPWTQVRNFN